MNEAEPMVSIDDFLAVIQDLCPECCNRVKRALIHRLATKATPIPLEKIVGIARELIELLQAIAEDHGFTVDAVRGHCQQSELVKARRDFAIQARERGYSMPAIGKAIARHHTTVINLFKKGLHDIPYRHHEGLHPKPRPADLKV